MHMTIRNSHLVISGEERNVLRCMEVVEDMLEEVEVVMNLPTSQLHALQAHELKYRKQIEANNRVFIALQGVEAIVIRGGVKAVKAAERAVTDLFRSRLLLLSQS